MCSALLLKLLHTRRPHVWRSVGLVLDFFPVLGGHGNGQSQLPCLPPCFPRAAEGGHVADATDWSVRYDIAGAALHQHPCVAGRPGWALSTRRELSGATAHTQCAGWSLCACQVWSHPTRWTAAASSTKDMGACMGCRATCPDPMGAPPPPASVHRSYRSPRKQWCVADDVCALRAVLCGREGLCSQLPLQPPALAYWSTWTGLYTNPRDI
jgi:hypothetical protein